MGCGGRRLIPGPSQSAADSPAWPSPGSAPLARDFFARPSLEVAPDLLGCVLAHRTEAGLVAVRLTEVEAYSGAVDPASHAYRGQTARNAVMFGPPGHAYVYFTYGMHFCMNLVCLPPGTAAAVLLRAGEVTEGEELARSRRPAAVSARDLARGPARLCQALGIDRALNGADVCAPDSALRILPPPAPAPGGSASRSAPGDSAGLSAPGTSPTPAASASARILTGPRVGVRDGADVPWRFWLEGEPTVSVYRPHVPRKRGRDAARGSSP